MVFFLSRFTCSIENCTDRYSLLGCFFILKKCFQIILNHYESDCFYLKNKRVSQNFIFKCFVHITFSSEFELFSPMTSKFYLHKYICSRYYTLGIAPIIFSFGLLLIFYLNLGNSCSDTFDEDSCIFCRPRPSWHSATWPPF